jgi:hypothetical protein
MTMRTPWKDRVEEPLGQEHFVQLYSNDRFLVEAVALYAAVGLSKGEAMVLIATPEHREGIEQRLRDDGLAVDDLKTWGQLVSLDAAEMLSRFMVGGQPDPLRFKAELTGLLDGIKAIGRPRIRAYGEMVNLLWSHNLEAAARLEELWNDLIRECPLSLFCAYWVEGQDAERRFPDRLRSAHSHLIPTEACA